MVCPSAVLYGDGAATTVPALLVVTGPRSGQLDHKAGPPGQKLIGGQLGHQIDSTSKYNLFIHHLRSSPSTVRDLSSQLAN